MPGGLSLEGQRELANAGRPTDVASRQQARCGSRSRKASQAARTPPPHAARSVCLSLANRPQETCAGWDA
eukprot:3902813-Alexandrium_andersonii.AAC.1